VMLGFADEKVGRTMGLKQARCCSRLVQESRSSESEWDQPEFGIREVELGAFVACQAVVVSPPKYRNYASREGVFVYAKS
jgi:hypothetical protein